MLDFERNSRHFACRQCGKCCDRSPEVGLSEAAALSDIFLFRLLLRVVPVPSSLAERQHVLWFSARHFAKTTIDGGHAYLVISALSMDASTSTCAALSDRHCSIYDRRPSACRTVPAHYSIAEDRLMDSFDRFVATPGYECNTGVDAPLLLEQAKLVAPTMRKARADAIEAASRDHAWAKAIATRVHPTNSGELPSVADLLTHADRGALTTSMRVAWEIALEMGLISSADFDATIAAQLSLMDRMIELGGLPFEDRATVADMRREYAFCAGAVAPATR